MLKKIDELKGHFFSITRLDNGKFAVAVRDKEFEDGIQWDTEREAYHDALNRLDDFAFELAFPPVKNVEKSDADYEPSNQGCYEEQCFERPEHEIWGLPHRWHDREGNHQTWT